MRTTDGSIESNSRLFVNSSEALDAVRKVFPSATVGKVFDAQGERVGPGLPGCDGVAPGTRDAFSISTHIPPAHRISFFSGRGVELSTPAGNVSLKGGGKRSTIKGWSKASRRRMREFMLTMRPPAGWCVIGATLTVPGPVITIDEMRKLWAWYCLKMAKIGCCMVWRLELQKRRQPHWHCCIAIPPPVMTEDELSERLVPERIRDLLGEPEQKAWFSALDILGPCSHECLKDGRKVVFTGLRRDIPGAHKYACDRQQEGSRGAWLRYLQDHATKAKQDQIASGIGRHWGVVGRKHFKRLLPDEVCDMDQKQYSRALRALQRLATPFVSAPGKPFGSKLGYRVRRGSIGKSVWFSNTDTVKRICEWATGVK